jgi:hypothetical protein
MYILDILCDDFGFCVVERFLMFWECHFERMWYGRMDGEIFESSIIQGPYIQSADSAMGCTYPRLTKSGVVDRCGNSSGIGHVRLGETLSDSIRTTSESKVRSFVM